MDKSKNDKVYNRDIGMQRLESLIERLRDPENGCPWDIEQDFLTLSPYTIEEAYEVEEAIRKEDFEELKEELGDLLLQVVFHSQIAAELGLNFKSWKLKDLDKISDCLLYTSDAADE